MNPPTRRIQGTRRASPSSLGFDGKLEEDTGRVCGALQLFGWRGSCPPPPAPRRTGGAISRSWAAAEREDQVGP